MDARAAALAAEEAAVPRGSDERFAGYGVMGAPFSSGYLLALRRFPVSTVGPAYSAVWMREPDGTWTMAATVPPAGSCARYFGSAVEHQLEASLTLEWPAADTLRVRAGHPLNLDWALRLASTPLTEVMSAACSALPDGLWRRRWFSQAMAAVASAALGTGTMRLSGRTPNRQDFVARPRRVWLVAESSAKLNGANLGSLAPLARQESLGDFWLPQRGLFMVGWSAFNPGAERRADP